VLIVTQRDDGVADTHSLLPLVDCSLFILNADSTRFMERARRWP